MSEHNLSDQDSSNALRVPACDSCRARKIRCDRKNPCASCKSSGIICRTTKRTPEKRQRILVSGRYEREIEDVNSRLASVERILQTIANNNRHTGSGPSPHSHPEGLATPQDNQRIGRALEYEGDSSFAAHTKQATQAFENSLGHSSHSSSIQDVAAAVADLRSLLNDKSATTDGSLPVHNKSSEDVVQYPELSNLALPPPPAVLSMLRYVKTHPQKLFYDVPIIDEAYLTVLCQKIYFPAEEYTIAVFITVHTSLYYLFRDLPPAAARELGLTACERDDIVATCKKNAEMAMRNVRLFMETNYENIEAITLSAMLAMENSHPSFAWTLITTAGRMVQDAGYHRLPPYSVAPDDYKKRLVFWIVYGLDRGMSINLGRSPTLQDRDITVERPRIPGEVNGAWGAMYANWLDFAQLQGEIYDQLYCARAQRQPLEVKAEVARGLAARLLGLKETLVVNLDNTPFPAALSDAMLSVEIVLDSTLTLIYRMIPPTPRNPNQPPHPLKPSDEALQAARKTLIKHNKAWEILQDRASDDWRQFIHWTLIWCPFVPFIVVFGNVIAERYIEDLRLLEHVVCTLQGAAQLNPGVGRIYRACRIFYHVATVYFGNGAGQTSSPNQQNGQQQPESAQPVYPARLSASSSLPPDPQVANVGLQDFPLSQQDWDGMLDEWDLGLGAESAREMSSFFESYLSGSGQMGNMQMGNSGPFT